MSTPRFASFAVACTIVVVACRSEQREPAPGERWWADVKQLASDDMQGRLTGSEGYRKAAQYVVEQFQRVDVQPAGSEAFYQRVEFEGRRLLEERSKLELSRDGKIFPLRFGTDAILLPVGQSSQPFEGDIVFAGYGLTIPEYHHDDFEGLNVTGKVVAFLQGAPPAVPSTVAAHYSSLEERVGNFERLGAAGALLISNPRLQEIPWERLSAMRAQLTQTMDLADSGLRVWKVDMPGAMVNGDRAANLLGISAARFAEILKLDADRKPLPKFAVRGKLRATVAYQRSSATSDNVVAMIPGNDPKLKGEYVLLSAHLDHTGIGEPVKGDSVYNGAMDNASGVATLLEVARLLRESSGRPRRSILFLACTGEEMGLLGSKYFAGHPTVAIADVIADINLDMFLPIIPLRTVRGYGVHESDLSVLLEAAATQIGITVQDDPEPERNIFIRSDQYSFIKKGVPSLFLSVGYQPDTNDAEAVTKWFSERYHAPSDDANQPVNLETAARFNQLITKLVMSLANTEQRPQWRDDSFFRRFALQRPASH